MKTKVKAKKKGINACKKGKAVELELAHWFKDRGVEDARRTQQHNGADGKSDVVAEKTLPHWHIESKGCKPSLLTRSTLTKWLAQLNTDCPDNQRPVLFCKSNGKSWVALFRFKEITELHFKAPNIMVVTDESFNPTSMLHKAEVTHRVYEKLYSKKDITQIAAFELELGSEIYAMDADVALAIMLQYETEAPGKSPVAKDVEVEVIPKETVIANNGIPAKYEDEGYTGNVEDL